MNNDRILFEGFGKISRLSREIIITEKLDGSNAQVYITDQGEIYAGSRNRWINPSDDNYGFAAWVDRNKDELLKLGEGRHFGEWWGCGINRNYGLSERRFSLFNVSRWNKDNVPSCCHVVPVLYQGIFDTEIINRELVCLETNGSIAAKGFIKPEGIVVFHTASGTLFKKTIENDDVPKTRVCK